MIHLNCRCDTNRIRKDLNNYEGRRQNVKTYSQYHLDTSRRHMARTFLAPYRNPSLYYDNRNSSRQAVLQGGVTFLCPLRQKGRSEL